MRLLYAQIKILTNLTRVLNSLSGANHVGCDPLWSVFGSPALRQRQDRYLNFLHDVRQISTF
jgi:hypothetical protein